MRLRVPSRTTEGVMYTLNIFGGRVRCSCPGFYFKRHCWHSQMMREQLDYTRQMKLQSRMFGGVVRCS